VLDAWDRVDSSRGGRRCKRATHDRLSTYVYR